MADNEVTEIGADATDDKTFYAKWLTVTDAHLESGKCDSYDGKGGLMGHQVKSGESGVGRTIIGLTQEQLDSIGDTLVIVGGDYDKEATVTIDCAYTYFYNQTKDGENEMITAKNMGYAAFVIIEKDEEGNDISGYGYYRIYNGDEDHFMFDVMYKKPNN